MAGKNGGAVAELSPKERERGPSSSPETATTGASQNRLPQIEDRQFYQQFAARAYQDNTSDIYAERTPSQGVARTSSIASSPERTQSVSVRHERAPELPKPREPEPAVQVEEKPGFWGSLWGGVKSVCNTVYDAGKTLANAGASLVKAIPKAVEAVASGVEWVVKNPDKVLNALRTAGEYTYKAAVWAGENLLKGAVYVVTHPVESLKAAGSFIAEVSEAMGITDILRGGREAFKGAYYALTGDFSKAGECFQNSLVAVRGAFTAFTEFTGLADGWRCISCMAKGDWAGVAINGALAGIGIAGLFTGGALNVGKVALTAGVKTMAKEAGKQVVKEVAEKISTTMLKEAGEAIAKESLETLAKVPAKELSAALVKETVKDTAEKATVKLLTENGVQQIVENSVTGMLHTISNSSRKEMVQHLTSLGIKESQAKSMARALQKGIQYPQYDKLLKEIITDEITAQLKKDLMERGMREGFEKNFKEGIEKLAKQHGLDPEPLLKAGREGFEEGVEAGVRRVVREGVESAFKKFREERKRIHTDSRSDNPALKTHGIEEAGAEKLSDTALRSAKGAKSAKGGGRKLQAVKTTNATGETVESVVDIGDA